MEFNMSENTFEVVNTFYVKKSSLNDFNEAIVKNKKKIEAMLPAGIKYLGAYVHGFGDTFKYENRFLFDDASLLKDFVKITASDDYIKMLTSHIDTDRPVTSSTLFRIN